MIDEYWTWKFYGYHSDELSFGSHKPIVARCEECCQYRISKSRDYRDLCVSCVKKGKNRHFWKSSKITVVCRQCGKEFDVKQSAKDRAKFCSMKCKGEWMSENLVGENSLHWNPNITDEERIVERHYPEYKQWRKAVYKRDNYTCQVCGDSTGGNLNAHHIESYRSNPEHRTELSNGITMCKDCHINFHHIYGKGNNTRDQYNEFLMTMYVYSICFLFVINVSIPNATEKYLYD